MRKSFEKGKVHLRIRQVLWIRVSDPLFGADLSFLHINQTYKYSGVLGIHPSKSKIEMFFKDCQ